MSNESLPEFLRLSQILGAPRADPPIPPMIKISKSYWYSMVKKGLFPQPLRPFGKRIAVYRKSDICALFESLKPDKEG